MENSKEIVNKIKQEEADIEDEIVPDQFTVLEFVGDIKHEPERHFVFIMPDDPEPEIEEVKEVKIVLRKFDRKWKTKSELFEQYYHCNKCDYVTKKSGILNTHFITCKNFRKCEKCFLMSKSEIVKECGLCDLKFDCKNCKTNHINQDHFKGSFWHCTKCNFKKLNKDSLRKHYQTHAQKFSCETCKKKFSAKRDFNNHQQKHRHGVFATESEIKFECRKCVSSFATKQGLKHHERYFHCEMKFHCDICGQTSKTKGHLQIHMQIHRKIPCPICEHLLTEHRFKEHLETHSKTEKFKCDECKKVYFNNKALQNHKRTVHEIDQVQCDMCSKIFKNKFLIRLHMTNHLKGPCPMCSKQFTKSNLKKHIKAAHSSGEKSLACNIQRCQQKFENIKELKDHEKIHIGTGIYKCPKCNYQPKSFWQIKGHMKMMSHKI